MTRQDDLFKSISDLFGALSNPVRIQILNLLREKEHDVSWIQNTLGISQSGTSQHLMLLKKHGLVTERRDGKHVYYRLKTPEVAAVLSSALHFMSADMVVDGELVSLCNELMTLWVL